MMKNSFEITNEDICKFCKEKCEEPCCDACPLNLNPEDIFCCGERTTYNPQRHFPTDS